MIINVLEYLEESARRSPGKTAFADMQQAFTYRQVLEQAQAVGTCLADRLNGQTNRPVIVLIDRDALSPIMLLGVVYSGNFYVPLDLALPHHRIEQIFSVVQPAAMLLPQTHLDAMQTYGLGIPLVTFEEAIDYSANEQTLTKIRKAAIDTDPLYAIFTSGSTGTPKGVLICHRSVIDLVEQFAQVFHFSEDRVFGNQAPFDFDVSTKDLYCTLRNAATMIVLPRILFSFPGKLIKALNDYKITTAIWATSALRITSNLKALEKEKPETLTQVMFSGEVMPNKVLNYWRGHLPEIQYVNLYGPTEITCNCACYIVDRPFDDNDSLPIGIPFRNTDILVLNDANKPVAGDEIGEICVRGTSLALGYYNNPEETRRAFCQNPLNPHYPELIYRTGDLGKYNEHGELMFLSRKDNQIKHMGHRIELGEIEVAANAIPFIDAACCLYDEQQEKIVLFYQAEQECHREVLLAMQAYLPKYMLPNRLIHVTQFVMNKNAKIDRILLKEFLKNGTG